MLMQFIAWVLGAPLILLTLAYATIFSALLAAKFRQTHLDFEHRQTAYPIADLRGVAQVHLKSTPR
jgi:hypothetical protein